MGGERALLLLALLVAACSRRDTTTTADARPAETAALLEAPPSPSPFSLAAARSPDDASRFPSRLGALAWETRVVERPDASSKVLGYLRAGGVVRAAAGAARGGQGCRGEWRAIDPVGFVCVEPGNATLDLDDPMVRALSRRPDLAGRLPYPYGIVHLPGPLYARLPTRAEAEAAEPGLDDHMRSWLADAGEGGASFRSTYWTAGKADDMTPAELWDAGTTRALPDWLPLGKFPPGNLSTLRRRDELVVGVAGHHNGVALVDTAVVEGRRYGVTTDLLVVPVDRLRPIEGSAFHGYRIPEDIDFPFAIVRRDGAASWTLEGGKLVKSKDLARRSVIRLDRKHQRFFHGVLYFRTTDGEWLSDRFVSRVDGVKRMPRWGKNGERWIDVSIGRQVLLAYEGAKPAYATLVSTGEAGLADPETSKSTLRGIFRIQAKHLTTTMESKVVGEEFELKDIPYVEYFEDGYALHAAYWHDDFGTPRSHGCINLSPEDARWLFQWTEPQLPRGWHGVRDALDGTVVFIHP